MTELRKTQGYMGGDPRRQAQELERSVQEALARVESNAPSFMGHFHYTSDVATGSTIKLYRYPETLSERINVNGKDQTGDAIKFDKPGYYQLNISTALRMGLGIGSVLLQAKVDGKIVLGAFVRSINSNTANVPLIGSGHIRVPLNKTLTFTMVANPLNNGQPETMRFSGLALGFTPNFTLAFIRPLEGGRDANR